MEFVFILSVLLIFYAYFGYPFSILLLGIFKHHMTIRNDILPSVTLIITAYNEENRIKEKLDNSINLEYPKDRIQIIVASDGSDDKTNEIVKSYQQYGVELLSIIIRKGKENAQNEAVKQANGEIIVFTDVATILEANSIKSITSNFADPQVGCVSSIDKLIGKNGKPSGEGLYVRYEMWLRKIESRVNSLVGLSGSFFAARKEVCSDFSTDMQSDFRTLLNSIKLNLKGILDSKTVGIYLDISNEKDEFNRKVRTVLRGMTVFFNHLEFLNFFRYRLFSYQYFCHKLLRWSVPFFLILIFISNLVLAFDQNIYAIIFIIQILFYLTGIFSVLGKLKSTSKIIKLPQYFIVVNYSILVAWIKFWNKETIVQWQPSKR